MMGLLTFQNGLILLCGLLLTNIAVIIMRKELNEGKTHDERIPFFSFGVGGWSRVLTDYRNNGRRNALALALKAGITMTFLGFACTALSITATNGR